MNEIPFSRLKPPSELFQLPARPAGGAVSLPLANPPAKPQPLTTPVSAPLPASDQTRLTPLKAARQTPAPVTLNDSPPAVSGSVAATKSAKSAPPVQASAGREIAPGIRLDSSRKSKDGAPIRVLTIDPARTQILPIVAPHGGPLDGDKPAPTARQQSHEAPGQHEHPDGHCGDYHDPSMRGWILINRESKDRSSPPMAPSSHPRNGSQVPSCPEPLSRSMLCRTRRASLPRNTR